MSDDFMVYTDAQWHSPSSRGGMGAHDYLMPLYEEISAQQETLYDNTKRLISVFQWGYRASTAAMGNSVDTDVPINEDMNTYNAAQNAVETLHSKICKSQIIPMPLTEGGGYLQRKRAEKLGHALEGEMEENLCDQIKEDVVMDALVTSHGAGCARVYSDQGRIKCEHVPIDDIKFDPCELRYRKPRSLFHERVVDRFVVLAKYGKRDARFAGDVADRRRAILACPAAQVTAGTSRRSRDQIMLLDAYHLSSGGCDNDIEDGDELVDDDEGTGEHGAEHDGRYVVCIKGADLVDEPWERDHFPYQFFVPRKRMRSVWGMSLMFNIAPNQMEYEKLSLRIQLAHKKMGGTHMVAPRSANVDLRDLDNGQGTFIDYDGQTEPHEWNPAPVHPETIGYHDRIPRDMRANAGISDMSTQSQVPAGLSQASGKALQVFEDVEDGRLLPYHRELDRWTIGLCWLFVEEAADLVANDTSYKARYRGKGELELVDWKDVLVDREKMVIKVFPVSALSKSPAAKFAQLTEMLNAGAITVEQFKRLYGMPDLEAESELDAADVDIIDQNLDLMVVKGRYLSPQPFDNLALCVERGGKFYNLRRQDENIPEARLKLIQNYIADAQALMDQAKAAAAPPPMPMGGPPPPDMGMMPSVAA